MRVCATPGCPALTRSTRCDEHRKQRRRRSDAQRPNAAARGYGARWRKVARQFLRENPVCADCGGEATVPDHSPLTRKQLLSAGIPDPDLPEFLEPRCKPCHDRKTATQDGGFGR